MPLGRERSFIVPGTLSGAIVPTNKGAHTLPDRKHGICDHVHPPLGTTQGSAGLVEPDPPQFAHLSPLVVQPRTSQPNMQD